MLLVLSLLVPPTAASAAPAVRLILSNDPCLVMPCPPIHPVPPTTVASGVPFGIYVAAVDGANARDIGYSGTVSFASTDPLASLPSSYTFVPADEGGKGFSAILRTLGNQTITVSDVAGGLVPGTLTMTVTGQSTAAVPALSGGVKMFFAVALAALGIWLLRLRH